MREDMRPNRGLTPQRVHSPRSDLHKKGRNCGWIRASRRFPFPDTYRVRASGDRAPIRDVLNKIRIEMGFGSLVKHHRKRPADRTRAPVVCKTAIRTASRGKVRAIRATLSRKGSFVPVIQALFGCVVSAVRASLIVQRWKPLWLSGDGKRGRPSSVVPCSGLPEVDAVQTQGE